MCSIVQACPVLSSEFKDIFDANTKKITNNNGKYRDYKEIIFCQPYLMNDRAKEPHGSSNNRTSIPEK